MGCMRKLLFLLLISTSVLAQSGAGKMGNLETGEGDKKFDFMNVLIKRKGGPKNITFTYTSLGFKSLSSFQQSLGFKDDSNEFGYDTSPYADLRIYSQLPRDWFLKLGFEYGVNNSDLRKVRLDLSGRRIGTVVEMGHYLGTLNANQLTDIGGGSSGIKKLKSEFEADFLRVVIYFKQLAANEGGERKTFWGLGFLQETKPTTLRYRNSLLAPENLTFMDSELEYQWLGLMAIRNPLRWIRLEGPLEGKKNGGYLASETLIGGMKARASSSTRYHLYRYSGNQGVKQDSWGGLGIWGRYELGYYWKFGTQRKPILINAAYNLNFQLPFFLRYLKFEKLDEFNDAEIEFPKNSIWAHGLSIQASMSF